MAVCSIKCTLILNSLLNKQREDYYLMSTTNSEYKTRFRLNKNILYMLMLLPGVIWFICEMYLPLFGLILAFKQFHFYRGGFFYSLFKSKWVWFDNFTYLFSSHEAWVITRNTLGYNIVFILLGTFLSVFLAIGFSQMLNKKLSKLFQTLIFCPYFITPVVIGYLVMSFMSYEHGAVNGLLKLFNITPINWYNEQGVWPYILVIVDMWWTIGYSSIIYLAAILGIGQQLYEAAEIEGASKWQQIRFITIPSIKPMIIVMVLIAIGGIFQGNFGLFYFAPMKSGSLFPVTQVINTYTFRALMFTSNVGMTSAACLYQSVMGLILVFVFNGSLRKFDPENAQF